MNLSEVIELLLAVVNLVLVFYLVFFKEYMKQKGVNLATKEDISEITRKIESVKSEFDLKNKTITEALSSFSSMYHLANDKRLAAIQTMWDSMIDFEQKAPQIVFFLDILLPDEIEKWVTSTKAKGIFNLGPTDNEWAKMTRDLGTNVDKNRVFLGEKLYRYYFIYRLFFGRLGMFQTRREFKKMADWINDGPIRSNLDLMFDKNDWEEIEKRKVGRISAIKEKMKLKILNLVNDVITGKIAAEENIEFSKGFLEAQINSVTADD